MKNAALFSSAHDEWATPTHVLDLARQVLGEIDLDPASSQVAQTRVNAQRFYTTNGLDLPWDSETLWLNPPYVRYNIGLWVRRWVDARLCFQQSLLLVPARTDARWFQPLWGYPMCFVTGRLKFGESKNSAPFPNVICYAGNQVNLFYEVFQDLGIVGFFRCAR